MDPYSSAQRNERKQEIIMKKKMEIEREGQIDGEKKELLLVT